MKGTIAGVSKTANTTRSSSSSGKRRREIARLVMKDVVQGLMPPPR